MAIAERRRRKGRRPNRNQQMSIVASRPLIVRGGKQNFFFGGKNIEGHTDLTTGEKKRGKGPVLFASRGLFL